MVASQVKVPVAAHVRGQRSEVKVLHTVAGTMEDLEVLSITTILTRIFEQKILTMHL